MVTSKFANFTEFRGEIYSNLHLIIFFLLIVPSTTLCILTLIAVAIAKAINPIIKTILVSLIVTEIILLVGLSPNFLGYPIRTLFNIDNTNATELVCYAFISIEVAGGMANISNIAFFSVTVYVFMKYNIKKVKFYMIIPPLVLIWTISIIYGLPVLIFARRTPPDNFIIKGFCPIEIEESEEFENDAKHFLIQLIMSWLFQAFFCGSVIIIFSALIVCYIRRHSYSNDRIKVAIAKNLLFLSVRAFFSIVSTVIYPTIIRFVSFAPDTLQDVDNTITKDSIANHIVDIGRSLSSIYTPIITIILLKPVNDAFKQFIVMVCKCRKVS